MKELLTAVYVGDNVTVVFFKVNTKEKFVSCNHNCNIMPSDVRKT
jgi:hypothetical protein